MILVGLFQVNTLYRERDRERCSGEREREGTERDCIYIYAVKLKTGPRFPFL